jgi:hypothetical protein
MIWHSKLLGKFDVRGSVHHSIFLTKKPNKMQQCIKILWFFILNEVQHVSGDTAYHQESKTAAYATWQRPTTARPTTFHVCKTRGCFCSFRFLMMGGVSPETCWAPFKIRNNKILIHCCILLGFSVRIVAKISGSYCYWNFQPVYMKNNWFLTHWGWGHLNCLNACSRGF